jgi:hypothetical protein
MISFVKEVDLQLHRAQWYKVYSFRHLTGCHELLPHRRNLQGIVDVAAAQRCGRDLPGAGIRGNVQLAAQPPFLRAVLL